MKAKVLSTIVAAGLVFVAARAMATTVTGSSIPGSACDNELISANTPTIVQHDTVNGSGFSSSFTYTGAGNIYLQAPTGTFSSFQLDIYYGEVGGSLYNCTSTNLGGCASHITYPYLKFNTGYAAMAPINWQVPGSPAGYNEAEFAVITTPTGTSTVTCGSAGAATFGLN